MDTSASDLISYDDTGAIDVTQEGRFASHVIISEAEVYPSETQWTHNTADNRSV